jgi:hypothetical protein
VLKILVPFKVHFFSHFLFAIYISSEWAHNSMPHLQHNYSGP